MSYKDQERREKMSAAQGGVCTYCKRPFPEDLANTAVDHIIPRCRGGPNAPWNFCLLHTVCNYAKGRELTPEAIALAKQHRVILDEPLRPGGPLGGLLREAASTGREAAAVIQRSLQSLRDEQPG